MMNKQDVIEHINYLIKLFNFYHYDAKKQNKIRQLIHAYEHKLNMLEV